MVLTTLLSVLVTVRAGVVETRSSLYGSLVPSRTIVRAADTTGHWSTDKTGASTTSASEPALLIASADGSDEAGVPAGARAASISPAKQACIVRERPTRLVAPTTVALMSRLHSPLLGMRC